jgi:hypothetical protein
MTAFQATEATFVARGGYKTNGQGLLHIQDLINWYKLNIEFL